MKLIWTLLVVVVGSVGCQTTLQNGFDGSPAISLAFQRISSRFDNVSGLAGISDQCYRDLGTYFREPFQHRWTLKMWDANGRLPSGMLSGTFYDPGDFDQCIRLRKEDTEPAIGHNGDYIGKYCIMEIRVRHEPDGSGPIADFMDFLHRYENFSHPHNGLCLPSSCSDDELNQIVPRVLIPSEWTNVQGRIKLCQEWSTQLNTVPLRRGQKVALVLFIIQTVLVLAAAILDLAGISRQSLFVRCFSAVQSTRQLFRINREEVRTGKTDVPEMATETGTIQLRYIHGIRVISIYWIIFAHVFLFYPFLVYEDPVSPVADAENRHTLVRNPFTHFVMNAGLAVETFFLISGAMTIYSLLPSNKDRPVPFYLYVLLRWLRFTPPVLGAMFMLILWPRIGDGPLFHREYIDFLTEPCYHNWWTSLTYVANLFPSNQACNVIHWYLSADFQLHILLYFAIYFFYKLPMFSIAYIVLMIVLGFLIPVAIVVLGWGGAPNPSIFLHPTQRFPMEKVDVFVFATYNHLIPYFLGVILGQILLRSDRRKPSNVIRFLGWFVLMPLFGLMPFLSYGFAESTEQVDTPLQSAIMFGIVRMIWSLGIFWLCLECSYGRAGVIGRLLSAQVFQPFSRLSFAIYLIHILSVWHWMFTIRQPIFSSLDNLLFLGMANTVCSTVLAYLLYILFERPYANLLRLVLDRLRGSSSSRQPASSSSSTALAMAAINKQQQQPIVDNNGNNLSADP